MPTELNLLFMWLPSLFLHMVRVGAFFAAQPLFGVQRESRMLRLVLATSVATMFFWTHGKPLVLTGGLVEFALMVTLEAGVGFAIGFGIRMIITAMVIAGEILGHETGFAMSRIVNPATGKSSQVIAQLFEVVSFSLMLELNVHHDVLVILGKVYEIVPVGGTFSIDDLWQRMSSMVGDAILYGIRYATPVVGVMMLLTATLVMLARAVQNINLMIFSFGLRIMLALLASVYLMGEGAPFLEAMFADTLTKTSELFSGS